MHQAAGGKVWGNVEFDVRHPGENEIDAVEAIQTRTRRQAHASGRRDSHGVGESRHFVLPHAVTAYIPWRKLPSDKQRCIGRIARPNKLMTSSVWGPTR